MKHLRVIMGLFLMIVAIFGLTSCLYINDKNLTAYENYFNKKLHQYERKRGIKEGQIIFVGDSITDHLEYDKFYPNLPLKYYNRGIGMDTTGGLLNRMDISIYDLKPSIVVLLIGINDFYGNGYHEPAPNDQIITNYKKILDGINTKLPDTKVIIQSISPIHGGDSENPSPHDFNPRIVVVNKALETIATEYGYRYVDIFSKLIVEVEGEMIMNDKYVSDGLHPNDEGKAFIAKIIAPIIIEVHNTK